MNWFLFHEQFNNIAHLLMHHETTLCYIRYSTVYTFEIQISRQHFFFTYINHMPQDSKYLMQIKDRSTCWPLYAFLRNHIPQKHLSYLPVLFSVYGWEFLWAFHKRIHVVMAFKNCLIFSSFIYFYQFMDRWGCHPLH